MCLEKHSDSPALKLQLFVLDNSTSNSIEYQNSGYTLMKNILICSLAMTVAAWTLLPIQGAAPADVTKTVDAKDLAAEAKAKAEKIAKAVESEENFKRALEFKSIATDAGTIACLAQALVEHKDGKASAIAAASLRDAALALRSAKTLDAAKTGLAAVNSALEGKETKAVGDFSWNKLINMHRMMEEMEYRQGRLRRTLRRPRNLERDSSHATVLAALALAMEADTHEVKKEADLPDWNKWAKEFRLATSGLAAAMKEGKPEDAKKLFATASQLCTDCHDKFRD